MKINTRITDIDVNDNTITHIEYNSRNLTITIHLISGEYLTIDTKDKNEFDNIKLDLKKQFHIINSNNNANILTILTDIRNQLKNINISIQGK